jgi:hypothetical protein
MKRGGTALRSVWPFPLSRCCRVLLREEFVVTQHQEFKEGIFAHLFCNSCESSK